MFVRGLCFSCCCCRPFISPALFLKRLVSRQLLL